MYFEPGFVYHIYNRGNNRGKIFFKDDNYVYFLRKAKRELSPHLHFLAYCLMPNHFHFLVQVKEPQNSSDDFKSSDEFSLAISNKIAVLLRSYTRAINRQEDRTGSLFQQKTRAKCLTTSKKSPVKYGLTCFNYIHYNPVIAGLVKSPAAWGYSSLMDYLGNRNGNFCNIELAFNILNIDREQILWQYTQHRPGH